MKTYEFINQYLEQTKMIADLIDQIQINRMIDILREVRVQDGRLFILGVGGSAANASHAVNDFRKIAKIQAYAPTDNVSELTARTNDEGWDTTFSEWLKINNLCEKDAVLVLSVGGGSEHASPNIVSALKVAITHHSNILGIVSRDGGYTAKVADSCIIIPTIESNLITPHAEGWQGIIWHLIVNALKEEEDEY